jgi:hypothetical protein
MAGQPRPQQPADVVREFPYRTSLHLTNPLLQQAPLHRIGPGGPPLRVAGGQDPICGCAQASRSDADGCCGCDLHPVVLILAIFVPLAGTSRPLYGALALNRKQALSERRRFR